jgi:hypothetical protein
LHLVRKPFSSIDILFGENKREKEKEIEKTLLEENNNSFLNLLSHLPTTLSHPKKTVSPMPPRSSTSPSTTPVADGCKQARAAGDDSLPLQLQHRAARCLRTVVTA